jgi:hypothetical protein
MAHACNPSYSDGSVQENHCWHTAQGNSLQDPDPILKNLSQAKSWWTGSSCLALSSNPSTMKEREEGRKEGKKKDLSSFQSSMGR